MSEIERNQASIVDMLPHGGNERRWSAALVAKESVVLIGCKSHGTEGKRQAIPTS